MEQRQRREDPARAEAVDEPPGDGSADPDPAASEPDTAPAIANDPVCSRRYSTMASALMPIGSRASRAEATSAPTQGARRISP